MQHWEQFHCFLRGGVLGGIRIGMAQAEVVEKLGGAEVEKTCSRKWRAIRDRSLEVWFTRQLVGLIQISFERELVDGRPSLPAALGVEIPFGVVEREEFCAYLDRQGIRWEPDTRLPGSLNLRVGENVGAQFDDEGRIMELTVSEVDRDF